MEGPDLPGWVRLTRLARVVFIFWMPVLYGLAALRVHNYAQGALVIGLGLALFVWTRPADQT